ncbi:6360_t:CDS:1, partial [Ambispora leptoticha]
MTERLNTIEETHHNNLGRIAFEFTSINASISTLQNEINRHYALVQRIEPIEEADQSEASDSSQRSFSKKFGT